MTITTIIVAALRDPEVASALREALATASASDPIPLARAAEMIGAPLRALRLAAQRGELAIEGPRCARIVRRGELDRWLASHRPAPKPRLRLVEDDDRAAARAAVAEAAARAARGRR